MYTETFVIILIFIFILGTIIGSFLNVVIYRLGTGKTIVNSRSICMNCNKVLRPYELIPIVSYILQLGKCRRCQGSISFQYPLVEAVTGFLFVLITLHFFPMVYSLFTKFTLPYSLIINFSTLLILFLVIFSLLVIIFVYDIRHKIIPDKLAYSFALLSFLSIFINASGVGKLFIMPNLIAILAGPILAIPFALIWLVSRGRAMGLGDSKLILGIGWMLGLIPGLVALTISFWMGAIVGLVLIVVNKKMNMKSQLPFAPFLILGTLILFIFNDWVMAIFAKLFF